MKGCYHFKNQAPIYLPPGAPSLRTSGPQRTTPIKTATPYPNATSDLTMRQISQQNIGHMISDVCEAKAGAVEREVQGIACDICGGGVYLLHLYHKIYPSP